jgi:hypothetical protein
MYTTCKDKRMEMWCIFVWPSDFSPTDSQHKEEHWKTKSRHLTNLRIKFMNPFTAWIGCVLHDAYSCCLKAMHCCDMCMRAVGKRNRGLVPVLVIVISFCYEKIQLKHTSWLVYICCWVRPLSALLPLHIAFLLMENRRKSMVQYKKQTNTYGKKAGFA